MYPFEGLLELTLVVANNVVLIPLLPARPQLRSPSPTTPLGTSTAATVRAVATEAATVAGNDVICDSRGGLDA